jgi:transcriptional regulator with XRE-family HTH domain
MNIPASATTANEVANNVANATSPKTLFVHFIRHHTFLRIGMEATPMVFETERELFALIIGYRVREARIRKHMSQSELGQGLGSQSMISLIESGKQLPPADVLSILVDRLEEPLLAEYVPALQSGRITIAEVSASNHSILLDVLRTRRGRWNETHGQVALHLCYHYYTNQMFEIARELSIMIREHLPDHVPFYAEASFLLGSSLLFVQEYQQAEAALRDAERRVDALREDVRGRLFYNLGYLYTENDEQGLALWYAKNAVETFHRNLDFGRYSKSLGLLGCIQGRLGRLEDARDTLELCYEISGKWGISEVDRGRIEATLAGILAHLEQYELAKAWADRAKHTSASSGDIRTQCTMYLAFVQIYQHEGDVKLVVDAIHKSVHAAELTNDRHQIAQSQLIAALYLPDEDERLQAAKQAYEITAGTNLHIEHALAAEVLAQIYERQNVKSEAIHYQKVALQSYRDYIEKNSMFKGIIQHLPRHTVL